MARVQRLPQSIEALRPTSRLRATVPVVSSLPARRASCAAHRDSVPDRGSSADGCSSAHAAQRAHLHATPRRNQLAAWPPRPCLAAAESSSGSFARARNAARPRWESCFRSDRRARPPAAADAAVRAASLCLPFPCDRPGCAADPAAALLQVGVQLFQIAGFRQRHPVVAAEVSAFAFHAALLVAACRVAELALKAPVRTEAR